MRRLLGIAIVVVMVSIFAAACSKAADEPTEGLEVGDRFPNYETLTAKTIDGDDVALKAHKGKLLFIDFWATWCQPCRMELPYLALVHDEYAGDKLSILGISLDQSIDALRAMAKEYGLTYPQICDAKGWQSPYATMFGIRSIPTNFLLDGNGMILAKDMRGLAVEGHIAKALGIDSPTVHYAEARDYLDSTEEPDLAKAIGMLDKALEADPERPEFHSLAAALHGASGNEAKAVEHLEAVVKHKDKLPVFFPALQAYVQLGHTRLHDGDAEKATGLIDEAITAIKALDDREKDTYTPFIEQLEELREDWSSGHHKD
ncbi:MAG: redoxin domain-containing protein [Verrucomicrobia bacterium]|nr:redoxin domain-containing protein [Verrucomicrobiota bacterium]